jgi:hypothetical protein
VVAKVGERWAVNEQAAQKFDGERFNLRKLNELEFSKRYQIQLKNGIAVLEYLNNGEDINRTLETLKIVRQLQLKRV